MEGGLEPESRGGGVVPDFCFRFGRIEAAGMKSYLTVSSDLGHKYMSA